MFDGLLFHTIGSGRTKKFPKKSASMMPTTARNVPQPIALTSTILPVAINCNEDNLDDTEPKFPIDFYREAIVAKIHSDRLTLIEGDNG